MKLIDPRTGQLVEGPDENAEAAKQQFGLVTPEDYALQQQHGGLLEQAKTVGEQALAVPGNVAAGIENATGFGTAPGLVNETGLSTAQEIAPAVSSTPEALARAQANPTAATIGKVAGELPIYGALGAATGGLGAAAAEALGASSAVGAAAGITAESGALGYAQEAGEAGQQGIPISAENVAKNGLVNLALSAAFPVLGGAYNAVFGEARPLARAVQETIQRSARAGENITDPAVAAEHATVLQGRIGDTVEKLQGAVLDSKAKVVPNLQAQRDALASAAEEVRGVSPDVAEALDEASSLPGQRAYQRLRELATGNHDPDTAEALDNIVQDRALWGDQAVEHHNAVEAVKAAGNDPAKLAEAARGVPDVDVDKLLGDLDQHTTDQARLAGAQAFGEPTGAASTVSAAHESFTDTDYETAIKDIAEGKYRNTALLAQEAPGLRNLAAKDFAQSLNNADEVLHGDLSTLTKYDDYKTAAEAWSGRLIARQEKWLGGQVEALQSARAAIEAATQSGRYPLKGLGSKAQEIIDTGLNRIAAASGGQRMALVDGLKKQLDSLIMRAGRNSPAIDQYSRQFLIDTLRPNADTLREGLQDAKLFGKRLAGLQRDTNEAWHSSLNAIGKIQDKLTDRVRQIYGETGPDPYERLADPTTIENILASREGGGSRFRDELDRALEGLDKLAAARKTHGLNKLDRLDEFRSSVENMRKQYDFANVLRVAEKHAPEGGHVSGGGAVAASVAIHGAEFAGRAVGLPIGNVVRGMGAYSKLGRYIDNTVKPALGFKPSALIESADSAVDRVLASHLKRFRDLPDMQNVGVTHELLGEKTREALRAAGAPIAAPRKSGPPTGGKQPLSGGEPPSEAYQRARAIMDRRSGQSGAVIIGGIAKSPLGATIGLGAAGLGAPLAVHALGAHEQGHAEYLAADSERDTTSTARALTDPGYASELARRMSSAPSTIEQFQGEHASIQQAFMSQRDAVQKMLRDPGAVTDSLAGSFDGLEPGLRDSLAVKSMAVATYLHSELPPQRGVSVTRPNGLPPSGLEARTYALKFMAATKPQTAFDDAKRGQLRHEQVDALQSNWPELYTDLRSQTLAAMGDGRSSITQRMRANLLFGFGSALDPAFSPQLSAAAAAGRQARTQAAAKPPSSAPRANTSSLTPQGLQALNPQ